MKSQLSSKRLFNLKQICQNGNKIDLSNGSFFPIMFMLGNGIIPFLNGLIMFKNFLSSDSHIGNNGACTLHSKSSFQDGHV